MSRIRSKWTVPERKIHNLLKGHKIRHQMHPKIDGNPDIVLKDSKKAVFIHGCFWHKCPKCRIKPKSNTNYWLPKIRRNTGRDRKNTGILKNQGWKVIRIWEHEIKKDAKNALKGILNK